MRNIWDRVLQECLVFGKELVSPVMCACQAHIWGLNASVTSVPGLTKEKGMIDWKWIHTRS
jgi:hypothetical protein